MYEFVSIKQYAIDSKKAYDSEWEKRPEVKLRRSIAQKIHRSKPKVKAKLKVYNSEYLKTEKGKQKNQMGVRNHKYLQNASGIRITIEQWRDICERFNNRCAYCGIHEEVLKIIHNQNLSMDHVIPLSKGGKHIVENIVPSCRSCNSKKGTKIL